MTILKHEKLHVAGIEPESVVDGEGIRMTIFFQGCSHHCKGCQNPGTWNPDKTVREMTAEEIIEEYKKNPLLSGITLSGGEPFEQDFEALHYLCFWFHEFFPDDDIWCYTGYTLKELEGNNLLGEIDYLVDGPFILEERDLSLTFRGSRNQKIWKRENFAFRDVTKEFDR